MQMPVRCFAHTDVVIDIDEFAVPAEYVRPECAEGRNPWGPDADSEFFDQWLDCVYQ